MKKRSTDYNPNSCWIVTVQDWSKTNPTNAVCSFGTLNLSNFVDIDNLFLIKSKINDAFLIINE